MISLDLEKKNETEHFEGDSDSDSGVRIIQIDAGKYLEVNDAKIAEGIDTLEQELQASGKKPFLSSRWLKKPERFIWYLASLASVGGLLFGVDQSLISGAALYLPKDLNLSDSQESMVVGFTPLGAMGGALALMPLNDIFGRKGTIIISSIVFTVGAILEAAARNFAVMLVGRIILGLALGLLSGTVPAYISENCARRWRGGLVSLYQVMVAFGVMMGYVIAAIFNSVKGNWRYILGSSVVFSTILFFGMLTLPESTRWLMKRGRKLDAYQVWKYARGLDSVDERQEFYIMEHVLLYEKEMAQDRWLILDLFGTKRCLRAISVAVTCSLICQQMSGVNSIEYYQATLVQAAGLSPQNAVYTSLVGGGVMFLSTIPAIYLMDRLGRRTLTLTLIPGIAIGLVITGCSFLATNLGVKLGIYFWGIITYTVFWSPGLGPVPYLLAAEVYPTYLRSYGMSLASFCNWTGTFVTTYPFQYMANSMTSTGVFAGLYCGLLLLGAFYLTLFMPETKGTSSWTSFLEARLLPPYRIPDKKKHSSNHEDFPRDIFFNATWYISLSKMGRKFNADGTVNKFPGNTVVCHLPQQGNARGLFKRLLDFYRAFPILLFKNKISMLPSSSLHMTIFDCMHEYKRQSDTWPKELPRNLPMEQCNAWMVKRLTETPFEIDLPIRLQVDKSYVEQTSHGGMDTWKVCLLPLDEKEELKIKKLRVDIANALNVPLSSIESYKFHLTIAYLNEEFTEEESMQLKRINDEFHQEGHVVELGHPEICRFDDMFYMERLAFLGQKQ